MSRNRTVKLHPFRLLLILLLVALIILGITCTDFLRADAKDPLRAAVLYSGTDTAHEDTLLYLKQSLNASLESEAVIFEDNTDLSDYQILYLDKSLAETLTEAQLKNLTDHTQNGGFVWLPNELLPICRDALLGGATLAPIGSFPETVSYPEVSENYADLQKIVKDFESFIRYYHDFNEIAAKDFGYGVISDDIISLANVADSALYGVLPLGKGSVFFTNPMLPNAFAISSLSMEPDSDSKAYFSNTTAAANQLLYGEFASLASKQLYGYSVERILSSFASPAAAWQLHYEEITALENNSLEIFSELCKQNKQIASYTLIRNTYKWFERGETVSYLLSHDGAFLMDFNESAYSSGTHVVADRNSYLKYNSILDGGSYFVDYPEYTQTAYPAVADINQDGAADIIGGSSDGRFYLSLGECFEDGTWHVFAPQILTDAGGNPIAVSGHAAPCLTDLDGDGVLDIISGGTTGEIVWFAGSDRLTFEPKGVLAETGTAQSMPKVGDLSGDGINDLLVGTLEGKLLLYNGKLQNGVLTFSNSAEVLQDVMENGFAAPEICDYNADGRNDILLGTFDGYVEIYINESGSFRHDGAISCSEKNYKGNNNIKIGNNCVPVFYDINADGENDLIFGSLEYGVAMPIDSPYFPLRDKVQAQIDYAKENNLYVGMHFYTNSYASPEREKEEIALHKKALASYGIDASKIGSNQHTWRTSTLSSGQTLHSLKDSDVLWSSCSVLSEDYIYPESGAENVLSIPFFLDWENKKMLVTNTATLLYSGNGDAAMQYDLPISQYYHCDFAYRNEANELDIINRLQAYVDQNQYNFVKEDQLFHAVAASYNSRVTALKKGDAITISQQATDKDFGLYDKDFQKSTGVKIEFAEGENAADYSVSANVWRRKGNSIYVGLDQKVILRKSTEHVDGSHISRCNLPAEITVKKDYTEVAFKENGLMQLTVTGEITTEDNDWTVEFDGSETRAYKYGDCDSFRFSYK